jgi:hypothetical protein
MIIPPVPPPTLPTFIPIDENETETLQEATYRGLSISK